MLGLVTHFMLLLPVPFQINYFHCGMPNIYFLYQRLKFQSLDTEFVARDFKAPTTACAYGGGYKHVVCSTVLNMVGIVHC